MNGEHVSYGNLPTHSLWDKMEKKRAPLSFTIEITARCNNNCKHCFINRPPNDRQAKAKELTREEISRIADEAVELGTVWCLISGGEPLLREDFSDIYMDLKKKGLLVSIFTNATMITPHHIQLFKDYPPREIEITVYGVTRETYDGLSRLPGSFDSFMSGLDLLLDNGIKVRLKAVALRSNIHEIDEIARFCKARTKDYYRVDPLINLRLDGDPIRNEEIRSERLTPDEIASLDKSDPERFYQMEQECNIFINPEHSKVESNKLFRCGIGFGAFNVGYDGTFRLCTSLTHPDTVYDLRKGTLRDAWENFVPKVRNMTSNREQFKTNCQTCPIVNLCLWCPAHAYLEVGELDTPVDYFCETAIARARNLETDHE